MPLTATQKKILAIAKEEFLSHGYQKASLRNIAKRAGLTTGAVYGYYPDKEALFSALVKKPAEELMVEFAEMRNTNLAKACNEKDIKVSDVMQHGISRFCEYIYEHKEAFYLIICCSKGTKYHGYIDRMVEIEEKAVNLYLDILVENHKVNRKLDDMLVHILISSSFVSVFEVAKHPMSKEKAMEYAKELSNFYVSGWNTILAF